MVSVSLIAEPLSAQNRKSPSIKEQVILIPAGSLVEVKLKDKRKIRGRMGTASDDSFVVQYAKGEKVTDENIAFADVTSVKPKGGDMSSGAKIALGVAAGAGAMVLILVLVALALSN